MRNFRYASRFAVVTSVALAGGCVFDEPSEGPSEGEPDQFETGTASSALSISRRPGAPGGLGTQGPAGPTISKCDTAFYACIDACIAWGAWLGQDFEDSCTLRCEEQRIDCRYPGGPVDPFVP